MSFWRSWRRRRGPDGNGSGRADQLRALFSWNTLLRLLPLLALTAVHLVLFPPIRTWKSVELDAGQITDREIRAPFTFRAPRARRELEAARLEASRGVEPVYVREIASERSIREQLGSFFADLAADSAPDGGTDAERAARLAEGFRGLDVTRIEFLLRNPRARESLVDATTSVAENLLMAGIVSSTPQGNYSRIHVYDPETEDDEIREIESIVLGPQLASRIESELASHRLNEAAKSDARATLEYVLTPTLSYDDARTEEQRNLSVEAVASDREYARNERIIDSGVRVTREHLTVLAALEEARQQRALQSDTGFATRLRAGRILIVVSVLGGLWFLLAGRFGALFIQYRKFLLAMMLLAVFLGFSVLALNHPSLGPVTLPVVLLAMLTTVLFGEGVAARVTGAGLLLIALIPAYASTVVVVWATIAVVSIRSVRKVRNRNQFYKAIVSISAAYAITVTALALAESHSGKELARSIFLGVGSGVTCTALSLFLLPVFESLFQVTTDLTLLELSDLNHPLLMRMSLESPGTYHHSQVVGTLGEAGARRIGANSLKTRVGANYHDIGKLLKPRYYVENQKGGPNAHDELSPHMSALVIAAHVKDGVELGRQWGLPKEVTDFIPEHHGTSIMRYFYHKALERDDGATVKVDDFRYPGPKPQCKETAIVMLADGVEAATRSLRRPTISRIREMTRNIFQRRMDEGELDDCGLTLRDVAQIREAFIPILVGIHHQRVAYPGQREHEEKKERESIEARSRSRRGASTVATKS